MNEEGGEFMRKALENRCCCCCYCYDLSKIINDDTLFPSAYLGYKFTPPFYAKETV